MKEIGLALAANFNVSVMCFEFENWSKPINENIKEAICKKVHYIGIPGNRKPMLSWLASSFVYSSAKLFIKLFPHNQSLLSAASNKRSWLLLYYLERLTLPVDLIVGHNIGSFYPAKVFAQKRKIPFGIDIEDYHAGETTTTVPNQAIVQLTRRVLPSAAYLTGASGMILSRTLNDIGGYPGLTNVIMNRFWSDEFIVPENITEERVQLVWFSQQISYGRGLEKILPEIDKLTNKISLTLYGNVNPGFAEEWLNVRPHIIVKAPLPQHLLHRQLSVFDAGLAIETGKDINNYLAVSNKMLAYQQAGLFILASRTPAQEDIIISNPGIGLLMDLSSAQIAGTLIKIFEEKDLLRSKKKERFLAAREHSWENESHVLADCWKGILNKK